MCEDMHSPGGVNLSLILHHGGGKKKNHPRAHEMDSSLLPFSSGLESCAVLRVLVDSRQVLEKWTRTASSVLDRWTPVSRSVLEITVDSRCGPESLSSYEGKSDTVAATVDFNRMFHRKLQSRVASGER